MSKLLTKGPIVVQARGAILELSPRQVTDGEPRLVEIVRTLSPAHAVCAVVACALCRPLFGGKAEVMRA